MVKISPSLADTKVTYEQQAKQKGVALKREEAVADPHPDPHAKKEGGREAN